MLVEYLNGGYLIGDYYTMAGASERSRGPQEVRECMEWINVYLIKRQGEGEGEGEYRIVQEWTA